MDNIIKYFSQACALLNEGRQVPPSVIRDIEDAIAHLSKEDAILLYTDMCAIQIVHDTQIEQEFPILRDMLDCNDKKAIDRFHAVFIDNGQLVDRIADCIDMNRKMRQSKWMTSASKAERDVENQRKDSSFTSIWSQYQIESRVINRDAYQEVRKMLHHRQTCKSEWQSLIMDDPASLRSRPDSFWYAIQTGQLTHHEKRAV